MGSNTLTIPPELIEHRIFLIRGQKVIIDADLALLYGVTTKRLNEQVKRNKERFPTDFMFQLSLEEKQEVVANCDHLQSMKFSPNNPFAFTEHGAIMASSILNTPRVEDHDGAIRNLIEAIHRLMDPPTNPQKKHPIGFVIS